MRRVFLLLACLGASLQAGASTFNISPIRAELSAAHRTEALTITNAEDSPVVVQVHVLRWSQQDGAEQLDETRELLATPPVLQIAANSEQIIRVALRREPDAAQELTYRVIFEEVPQAAAEGFHRSADRSAVEHSGVHSTVTQQSQRGCVVAEPLARERAAGGCRDQSRDATSADHRF